MNEKKLLKQSLHNTQQKRDDRSKNDCRINDNPFHFLDRNLMNLTMSKPVDIKIKKLRSLFEFMFTYLILTKVLLSLFRINLVLSSRINLPQ